MQTKKLSLVESTANTAVGLVLNFGVNYVLFHYMLNVPVTVAQNLGMTILFTVISVTRGYMIRRLFNRQELDSKVRTKYRSDTIIMLPTDYQEIVGADKEVMALLTRPTRRRFDGRYETEVFFFLNRGPYVGLSRTFTLPLSKSPVREDLEHLLTVDVLKEMLVSLNQDINEE